MGAVIAGMAAGRVAAGRVAAGWAGPDEGAVHALIAGVGAGQAAG